MVTDSVTTLTDADRPWLRQRYEVEGYCISPPLVHPETLNRAQEAVAAVMAGEYETAVSPIYRNWRPGDPPRSLVKIDLPHLCNRDIQQLVAEPRIGRWAASVLDSHRWGTRGQERFFFDTDLARQRSSIGAPPGHTWHEVTATLPAGAVSMYHRLTIHASEPNRSDVPRIGLALHLRTERARLVPTPEPPLHSPDLIDSYACPGLFGLPFADVVV